MSCSEQAAWLTVKTGKGGNLRFGCQIWAPSGSRGRASTRASLPLPPRIVGQAHTHPTRCRDRRFGPAPSRKDKATARQINRVVYTISPDGVWVYDPNTDTQRRILPRNWTDGPEDRNCEPCEGIPQP